MTASARLPLFMLPLGLTVPSCVGPGTPPPAPPAQPAVAAAELEPGLAAREAARAVDTLTRLVAIDRKAVDVAEQQLAQARDLARAGRLGSADVDAAELELLELRRRLQAREQELADAQHAASRAASPASRG